MHPGSQSFTPLEKQAECENMPTWPTVSAVPGCNLPWLECHQGSLGHHGFVKDGLLSSSFPFTLVRLLEYRSGKGTDTKESVKMSQDVLEDQNGSRQGTGQFLPGHQLYLECGLKSTWRKISSLRWKTMLDFRLKMIRPNDYSLNAYDGLHLKSGSSSALFST